MVSSNSFLKEFLLLDNIGIIYSHHHQLITNVFRILMHSNSFLHINKFYWVVRCFIKMWDPKAKQKRKTVKAVPENTQALEISKVFKREQHTIRHAIKNNGGWKELNTQDLRKKVYQQRRKKRECTCSIISSEEFNMRTMHF